MPIYEYICKKCAHEFDEIQKFSDPPIKKCPKCKGKVEKKLSLPSFQLKGTGWYVTDFKDKPKKPAPPTNPGSTGSPQALPQGEGAKGTGEKAETKVSPEKKESSKKEDK